MNAVRPALAVIAKIPQDLRDALAAKYELVDVLDPIKADKSSLAQYRVAVTTAMHGASVTVMDAFPNLGLIACNGAALDKFDMAHAAKRGIHIRNTSDELTVDTAEFAIALVYAVSRKVVEADSFVRAGRWLKERMAVSHRVSGKTAGIVGLGKIGQVIAQRAAGAGMNVMYHGRAVKPGAPYTFVAKLEDLAAQSDVMILSCTGGEETRHLVTAKILERLGPAGILINVSRGSVVDEAALLDALESKKIYGAGLDVFAIEPQLDERFLRLGNAVLAPHYASVTAEARLAIIKTLSDSIAAHLAKAA
jgi:hydroxypyruvate reductase